MSILVQARMYLSAVGLMAAIAHGVEPLTPAPELHPLVSASEVLYRQHLARSCDEVRRLASTAPGITKSDRARLHFLAALRAFDDGDKQAAGMALSQAVQMDRSAALPSYVPAGVLGLLHEAQGQMAELPANEESGDEALLASQAGAFEPPSKMLLRAVDVLYDKLQIEGAGVVLGLLRSSSLTPDDAIQVALRQGVLRMEMHDEAGARVAFRQALMDDRSASLPPFVAPKIQRLYDEVRLAIPVAQSPPDLNTNNATMVSVASAPDINSTKTEILIMPDSPRWELLIGGAGLALVAGGAVAGTIAFSAHQEEQRAAADGDVTRFLRNRETANAAMNVADGLYAAGAIVVGVSAFLYWRVSSSVAVGASAGGGRAAVQIGGRF